MSSQPTVLVTRKLPDAVEARLRRDYDARLNPDDRLYSHDELIEHARGAHAILPCHTEHFTAQVLERLPAEVRIIANFSVGYDHVDGNHFWKYQGRFFALSSWGVRYPERPLAGPGVFTLPFAMLLTEGFDAYAMRFRS